MVIPLSREHLSGFQKIQKRLAKIFIVIKIKDEIKHDEIRFYL